MDPRALGTVDPRGLAKARFRPNRGWRFDDELPRQCAVALLLPRAVGIVIALVSVVALVQGAAWLGPRTGPPRARSGAALATLGALGLGGGLLLTLVPGLLG